MNYSLQQTQEARDLIMDTLAFLCEKGIINIDTTKINGTMSALNALEDWFINGPEVEDTSEDGKMRKAIHFVMSAVYFDGTQVIDENIRIVDPTI